MDGDPNYLRVAAQFTATLRSVTADQWTNATPCVEWDVADLVRHADGLQPSANLLKTYKHVVDHDPSDLSKARDLASLGRMAGAARRSCCA